MASREACEYCQHWTVRRETVYSGGQTIENWKAPDGKGACASLGIETDGSFGCNRFIEGGGDHIETKRKVGYPWQHFVMIPCPDCAEKNGDGAHRHRCAGTGLVRLYDDGYIADEQTRMHPKEKELAPAAACPNCAARTEPNWAHCPACGSKLWKMAETEVVTNEMAGLPPPEPAA